MQDIPNLREITYELTTACGANCIMCVRNQYSPPGKHMEKEAVLKYTKKVVDAAYNAIVLGGMGDPLAYRHIEWFLREIKRQFPQMSVRLTTTGQLLTEDILPLVCENTDILKISNYGFTKPIYERVHRGTLVFEHVQENLQRLAEYSGRKPYIIMSYLDMEANHEEVLPWVDYWTRFGISEVNVWKAHNWGGHKGRREEISDEMVYCARIRNHHFKLWVDGAVSACTFDCNRDLWLGNLNDEDFSQIYQRYQEIERIHNNGAVFESNLICRNCDQMYSRENALLYLNENGMVLKDLIHNDLVR